MSPYLNLNQYVLQWLEICTAELFHEGDCFFPFGHLHLSVSLGVNLRVREQSFFLAHI